MREGSAVVLRCKAETHSTRYTYDFLKDGDFIWTNSTGELIINAASKSDEGSYTCSISGGAKSESSWLVVSGDADASQLQISESEYF